MALVCPTCLQLSTSGTVLIWHKGGAGPMP